MALLDLEQLAPNSKMVHREVFPVDILAGQGIITGQSGVKKSHRVYLASHLPTHGTERASRHTLPSRHWLAAAIRLLSHVARSALGWRWETQAMDWLLVGRVHELRLSSGGRAIPEPFPAGLPEIRHEQGPVRAPPFAEILDTYRATSPRPAHSLEAGSRGSAHF